MKIQVTKEDIANGKPKKCARCPVALAIQRATASKHGCKFLSCTASHATFRINRKVETVGFPNFVSLRISMYDAGGTMEPFEFNLELPQ